VAYRKNLQAVLQEKRYQALLYGLRRKDRFFREGFKTWEDVETYLKGRLYVGRKSDRAFRPIFQTYHKSRKNRPRWREVLTVLLWPVVEKLCRRHWGLEPEKGNRWPKRSPTEERWNIVMKEFLGVLVRAELHKRPDNFVWKVRNDLNKKLWLRYSQQRKQEEEVPTRTMAPGELEEIRPVGERGAGESQEDWKGALVAEVGKWLGALQKGWINKEDFLVAMVTRVKKKSLSEFARRRGLDYERLRKRRQRVDRAGRIKGGGGCVRGERIFELFFVGSKSARAQVAKQGCQACQDFLVQLLHPDGLWCPQRHPSWESFVHKRNRFGVPTRRCKRCGSFFNLFTGTLLQKTHYSPVQIVQLLHGTVHKVCCKRLAREIGVDRNSLRRRYRQLQEVASRMTRRDPLLGLGGTKKPVPKDEESPPE
jgi:hypothetical protein